MANKSVIYWKDLYEAIKKNKNVVIVEPNGKPAKGNDGTVFHNISFKITLNKAGKKVVNTYGDVYTKPTDNLTIGRNVDDKDKRIESTKKTEVSFIVSKRCNEDFYNFHVQLSDIIEEVIKQYRKDKKIANSKTATKELFKLYNDTYSDDTKVAAEKRGQKREDGAQFIKFKIRMTRETKATKTAKAIAGGLPSNVSIKDFESSKEVKVDKKSTKTVYDDMTVDGEPLNEDNIHLRFTGGSKIKVLKTNYSVSTHGFGTSISTGLRTLLLQTVINNDDDLLDDLAPGGASDETNEDDPADDIVNEGDNNDDANQSSSSSSNQPADDDDDDEDKNDDDDDNNEDLDLDE